MQVTKKYIVAHITRNYGELRHDAMGMKKASIATAKEFGLSSYDVFHFMVDDTPIPGAFTHSYGFHTREGRYIRDTFTNFYNNATTK